jgi:hypothetical protein
MSEVKIELKGWQAIAVVVVLMAAIAGRLMTLDDMRHDEDLMKHIDTLLMDEYAPYVAEKLGAAYGAGDGGEAGESVTSVLSTRVNIESVKGSYPVFDFSIPKDVVIKVTFSLADDSGAGEERTIYYLFQKGAFGWQYQYIATSLSYYLNFM